MRAFAAGAGVMLFGLWVESALGITDNPPLIACSDIALAVAVVLAVFLFWGKSPA